jgi:F0F1-type ATP synthase alpha subunit
MEIRAEEISAVIRGQIKDYEKKVEVSETGTVLSVGDGVARVYGVEKAMAMEMLEDRQDCRDPRGRRRPGSGHRRRGQPP